MQRTRWRAAAAVLLLFSLTIGPSALAQGTDSGRVGDDGFAVFSLLSPLAPLLDWLQSIVEGDGTGDGTDTNPSPPPTAPPEPPPEDPDGEALGQVDPDG